MCGIDIFEFWDCVIRNIYEFYDLKL